MNDQREGEAMRATSWMLVFVAALSTGCTLSQARWAYVAGAAADITTTEVALNNGLEEANPLWKNVEHPGIPSAAITAASIGFAEWAVAKNPKNEEAAIWFYRALATVRWTAAILNTGRLIEHQNEENAEQAQRRGIRATWRVVW